MSSDKWRILISCFSLFIAGLSLLPRPVSAKEYFVSTNGSDLAPGSERSPYLTIQKAADIMKPGDICTISAGTYREQIAPARGGTSDAKRIVYRSKEGDKVKIKGSDRFTGWTRDSGDVWTCRIDNAYFKGYNPYKEVISGEWLMTGEGTPLGDVYFNEVPCKWVDVREKVSNRPYSWSVKVDDKSTTIFANFGAADPNEGLTEVVVRKSCFLPSAMHTDFITLDGLTFMHSAPQWSPPGSFQEGMISTFWSRGWIIENCEIAYAKCVGICSGNVKGQSVRNGEMDKVLGHHIVRNNWIHHCGQAGIAGFWGWGASLIEGNLVEDINDKKEFGGMETAGIKVHAAIDTVIRRNVIRRVSSARSDTLNEGIWLDWAGQNPRITANLIYDIEDNAILLEMNHGPQLIDNNVIIGNNRNHQTLADASEQNVWVHNLFIDCSWSQTLEDNRQSGYYKPHIMVEVGAKRHKLRDDWFYNNIFVGKGTDSFVDIESWHIDYNVYYDAAKGHNGNPFGFDAHSIAEGSFSTGFGYDETKKGIRLRLKADTTPKNIAGPMITRQLIGTNSLTKQGIENHDGSAIVIDSDFFGMKRDPARPCAGPFEDIKAGTNSWLLEAGAGVPVSGDPRIVSLECSPSAVVNDKDHTVKLVCKVSDPDSRIASMTADLSQVGGPKEQAMTLTGKAVWSCDWVVSQKSAARDEFLTVKITDKAGHGTVGVNGFRIVAETKKNPVKIPGTIEAAEYKQGGSGIGYQDSDPGNNGGAYRQDDVDIEKCEAGGYDVGWTVTGEWLAYDIDVSRTGSYELVVSAGSGSQGTKSLHIELDGKDISGPMSFDDSDGWQNWHPLSKKGVNLTAGSHELRIVVDSGLFNLRNLRIQ